MKRLILSLSFMGFSFAQMVRPPIVILPEKPKEVSMKDQRDFLQLLGNAQEILVAIKEREMDLVNLRNAFARANEIYAKKLEDLNKFCGGTFKKDLTCEIVAKEPVKEKK